MAAIPNHNEKLFAELQQTINAHTQRLAQIDRDIETNKENLESMLKERDATQEALTRNQGGLSLCWAINNSGYIVTDNPGESAELGQSQMNLRGPQQASTPQAPTQSQPSYAPLPGEQQITKQAQETFAPPQQGQLGTRNPSGPVPAQQNPNT